MSHLGMLFWAKAAVLPACYFSPEYLAKQPDGIEGINVSNIVAIHPTSNEQTWLVLEAQYIDKNPVVLKFVCGPRPQFKDFHSGTPFSLRADYRLPLAQKKLQIAEPGDLVMSDTDIGIVCLNSSTSKFEAFGLFKHHLSIGHKNLIFVAERWNLAAKDYRNYVHPPILAIAPVRHAPRFNNAGRPRL
jgi:hypothetical protein